MRKTVPIVLMVIGLLAMGCGGSERENPATGAPEASVSGLIPLADYLPVSADDSELLWKAFAIRLEPCLRKTSVELAPVEMSTAVKSDFYTQYRRAGRWGSDDVDRAHSEGLWQQRSGAISLGPEDGPLQPSDPADADRLNRALGDSPQSGCWSDAVHELGWDPSDRGDAKILDLASRAYSRAKDDGRRILEQWSACMERAGFPNRQLSESPYSLNFDGPVTEAERDIAVSEAECNRDGNLADRMEAIDVRIQKRYISDYEADLMREYEAGRARVREAQRVLAE